MARRFNLSYPTRAVVTCRTASVRYKAAGLTDVTIRTYPGARHEILDETNRNEVVAELTTWLDPVSGFEARRALFARSLLEYSTFSFASRHGCDKIAVVCHAPPQHHGELGPH